MVTSKCTHAVRALCAAAAAGSVLLAALPASAGPDPQAQEAPGSHEMSEERAPVSDGSKPTAEEGTGAREAPASSGAAAPAPIQPRRPEVHHSPVSSAESGKALTITASIDRPQFLRAAYVVYKANDKWYRVKLLRNGDEGYGATIPAEHVKPPSLAYSIEVEHIDGYGIPVFATRSEPQPINVHEDSTDVREKWQLDRFGGRRSLVATTGEFVRFGPALCTPGKSGCPADGVIDDQYWRVEASYTYRLLRTVSEFGVRAGVVRGRSPVDTVGVEGRTFDVGLNYAGPNVRFRAADIFHMDFEFIGSVTEIGFSTGAGAAMLFGDPHKTKFTIGWQTIGFTSETYFGTRFYTRLDLPMGERVTIAPSVEVTDMPHAAEFGVRLIADAGVYIGRGFSLWLRGGYQARISKSGGPAAGATVQYGF